MIEDKKMLKLKEIRVEKNLLQKDVAEKMQCTCSCISSWEKEITEPSIDDLIRLADFFGCTVDYLIGREEEDGFDTQKFLIFSKFFHIFGAVLVRFFIRRSRGETFMKIRALTFRLRRVFFLKNNIAVPVRAFLSFSAFVVVRGDVVVGDSDAGAWNKGIFRSEATPIRASARISTCALLTMSC